MLHELYLNFLKLKTKTKKPLSLYQSHLAFRFFWWTHSILVLYLIPQKYDHQNWKCGYQVYRKIIVSLGFTSTQ